MPKLMAKKRQLRRKITISRRMLKRHISVQVRKIKRLERQYRVVSRKIAA